MHEYLTRALQLAQKWRQMGMQALRLCVQSLAMVSHRVSNLVWHYAPIIRQSCVINARNAWQRTLQLCRICINHAVQFMHRVIFMATALGNRIAELLRYYTPIVREFILKASRQSLDLALKFARRVISMATNLGNRIAEFLRHNIPIYRQFLISTSEKTWQSALNFCRLCLERAASLLRQTVILTTAWKNITARVSHDTPIALHDISSHLQDAWRVTGSFCRDLFLHAIKFTRTVVRGFINACVLVIRFLHGRTRRIALAVTAISRRFVTHVQHYLPIMLQTADRGLQVTAQALISSGRSCIRLTESTVRVITAAVLSMLARTAKIIQELLLAVKNLLLFVARALITICRIAGYYLGQGSRRLFHTSRFISVRASERLYQYVLLTRLNKPIGIFLLLWPTLWALWIAAKGTPDLPILFIFIGGVVLMRSAGCIINDLADRDFDAHVSRTRMRPLATGKVTPKEALVVAGVLLLCAFLLVLQLNRLTIGLSVIGALLAIMYPFTKRYTYMPQFFLGLTFGWAVPMAFAAQTGAVPAMAWILLMATVLWALVYDTMYAMVDRAEDIKLGIKSTAILFEDADRIIIGIIQLLVVLTLLLIGSRLEFNGYYYAGLAIATLLFIYQQHLIRERVPAQCFSAFLNNNWFGAIVYGGILMNYQYG